MPLLCTGFVLPPAGRSVSIGRQRHVGSQQTCLSVRLIMPRRRQSDFVGGDEVSNHPGDEVHRVTK